MNLLAANRADWLQEYEEDKVRLEATDGDEDVEKVKCLKMINANDDAKCDGDTAVEGGFSHEVS